MILSMKKLYSFIAASVAAVLLWSCGPAEQGFTIEQNLQGLYTVNKATVAPEFSDTFIFVRNIDNYDLKTGDRAFLKLHYFYDAYSGKAPEWNITEIIEMVPVRRLSAVADVDTSAYLTPLTGLQPVDFFNDFYAVTWLRKNLQNVSVKYKGVSDGAGYAMTVRGVKDGYVELNLYIDAEESDKETTDFLTFDIADVKDFLSEEEKAQLGDTIKTKIYTKRMKNGALQQWVIPGESITNY